MSGVVLIYCFYMIVGIIINENVDLDVKIDMFRRFDEVYLWEYELDCYMEGNIVVYMKLSMVGVL